MENSPSNYDLSTNSLQTDSSQTTHERATNIGDISLLEEKLIVKRHKRKLGEVIVRKEIETKTVHIPIRREKLIVEKTGTTTERLTEVDLGEGEVNGIKFDDMGNTKDIYQVQSEFVSLKTLQELLTQITAHSHSGNTKVRLEIITDNLESQQSYRSICGL